MTHPEIEQPLKRFPHNPFAFRIDSLPSDFSLSLSTAFRLEIPFQTIFRALDIFSLKLL